MKEYSESVMELITDMWRDAGWHFNSLGAMTSDCPTKITVWSFILINSE